MKAGQPFVYFLRPVGKPGPVKIGRSKSPRSRLDALMAWSPVPLEIVATIPGSYEIEYRVHALFAKDHTRREWFKPSRKLSLFIHAINAGKPIESLIDFRLPVSSLQKGRKRNYTPERRLYLSYSARVRNALRKVGCWEPDDVSEILRKWGYGGDATFKPPAAALARLDDVLANPLKHGLKMRWGKRQHVPTRVQVAA